MTKFSFIFVGFLLLQGTTYARSVLINWKDNSENEKGFVIERTEIDNCIDGWEAIAYAGPNETALADVRIPGACYRVAAYNEHEISPYSNVIRVDDGNAGRLP